MSTQSSFKTPVAERLILALRRKLQDPAFVAENRTAKTAFCRLRILGFDGVALLILQRTVRSIQNHLHEFLLKWTDDLQTVTPGAFTKARAKLRHGAFVRLNTEVLLPALYDSKGHISIERWHGHRVLAVDSSLIRLPSTVPIGEALGWVEVSNQNGKTGTRFPQARISVLYDVLNKIGWDARLVPQTTGEIQLAREHLAYIKPGDILLMDRGYAGYVWFVQILAAKADFVARCSQGSFLAVQKLFERNESGVSQIVTFEAPTTVTAEQRKAGVPRKIQVRLITVRLSTGELEVLATSLLDEQRYPTHDFAQLYHRRWGIETYYGLIKGRLDLEHWSGKTVESIYQDFHATVFLSNLESVITRPAQNRLEQKNVDRKNPVQVNRAVSLHAIKCHLIELLVSQKPPHKVIATMERLFMANPVSRRPDRKIPRKKILPGQSYHFQRNVRKRVF